MAQIAVQRDTARIDCQVMTIEEYNNRKGTKIKIVTKTVMNGATGNIKEKHLKNSD